MSNGAGVSVSVHTSGRWRVRWRERVVVDGGPPSWKQRERMVDTERAAIELRSTILRAVETSGTYTDPAVAVARVASYDAAAVAWLRARQARGAKPSTLRSAASILSTIASAIRHVRGIPGNVPIPGPTITRALVVDVTNRIREEGYADATVYFAVATLIQVWTHASDDPEEFPGFNLAPRDTSVLRPKYPIYVAPPAPTLAECDAALRALGRHKARGLAIVARYTGLRTGQIRGAKLGDLDVHNRTLLVRVGKSAREVAERRTIPVSAAFLRDVAPHLGDDPAGPLLIRNPIQPSYPLTAAWESATAAGLARRAVWAPEHREIARPDHAFRAAYQAHLVRAGVAAEVIDALVGHAGSTRSRHYSGPDEMAEAMRTAVEAMPPIDWQGPGTASNVVTLAGRR